MSDPEEQTAVALMDRALASRDPLELAIAGFLSAYKGRTFKKQRQLIKTWVDWCIQNDLAPLDAKRPHIELYVRWCEGRTTAGCADRAERRDHGESVMPSNSRGAPVIPA